MTLAALAGIKKPDEDSVTLNMTTQTPLYTGGIGQWGDQVHPSGLLGSIRSFSCLVARTLGFSKFEEAVWGKAGAGQDETHAKRVSLHWDVSGLAAIDLPPNLLKNESHEKRGWYFNQAQKGRLTLKLTRRGISDLHWQVLLLALRIQIRHATFGAKDQFGLGVLYCEKLPDVSPFDMNARYRDPIGFNLQRCAFGRLELERKQRNLDDLEGEQAKALSIGLLCRMALRKSLRTESDDIEEENKWKIIRHRMMGSLNECGSATNVSSAYYPSHISTDIAEIRLFVQLRSDEGAERTEVMKRFNSAIKNMDLDGWFLKPQPFEFGGTFGKLNNPAAWLNKLAGL